MSLDRTKQDIADFLTRGWTVSPAPQHSTRGYSIHAPDGSVYHSLELSLGDCSYCQEEDEYCVHDERLLAQEQEAKRLNDLIESIYLLDRWKVLSGLLE